MWTKTQEKIITATTTLTSTVNFTFIFCPFCNKIIVLFTSSLQAYLTNLSHNGQTLLGDYRMAPEEVCMLSHKQVLSVGERKFRWEYPEGSPLAMSFSAPIPAFNIKILVPVDKSPLPHFTVRGGCGLWCLSWCHLPCPFTAGFYFICLFIFVPVDKSPLPCLTVRGG